MPEFFFTSPSHREQFVTALQKQGKVYNDGKIDSEYGAALYVLTSDDGTWDAVQPYVSSRGIRFDDILSQLHWSSGYITLLTLARDLFRSSHNADDPFVLIGYLNLDPDNYAVFMNALNIRRNPPHISLLVQAK